MRKKSAALISIILIIMIVLSSCTAAQNVIEDIGKTSPNQESSKTGSTDETSEFNIKDDFYNYVNDQWISNQQLDGTIPGVSNFNKVASNNFYLIFHTLDSAIAEGMDQGTDDFAKLAKFYKTARDFSSRNSDGIAPIEKYIDRIKSISSIEDAQIAATELDIDAIGTFMMFGIRADLKDSNTNRLYLSGPILNLDEKSYYFDESERGQQVINAYKNMLKNLFELSGESEQDALKMAESAFDIERQLADSSLSLQESMNDDIIYNKFDLNDFSSQYNNFDVKGFLERAGLIDPEFVIVTEPKYYDRLDEIMVEKNLDSIKNFMYAQLLVQTADNLTSEHIRLRKDFDNIVDGTTGYRDEVDEAFFTTESILGEIMSRMYVEHFFSQEAKDEVEIMVDNIIKSYKESINNTDWLSDSTKVSAIKKLDTMSIKIGYPDSWQDYSGLVVSNYNEGGSMLQNVINHYKYTYDDFLSGLDQPVDKSEWNMYSYEANAYYNPSKNEIVFPAGILKAPFFDIEATESQNYGAIGSIIAHEISHAFDESGSRYDEFGNHSNWWTDEDRKNYDELTQKLVQQFEGYEVLPGYTVNGSLTLDENIADLSGMFCIVDIIKQLPNGNLDEAFVSYATIWASKYTDEHKMNLLIKDSHAPDILRVNMLLPNINEFHETYGISEGDLMYRPENERIRIW